MRKIYSLMLIAAGLLIGTQVWAQDVAKIGSKTYTDLQVAFDEATNGQTITLLKDFTVTKQLDFTSGQKVTLDLQNFELSGNNTDAAKIVIWIMKGDLTLAGTGKITNNLIKGGRAIRISGSRLPIIENNVPGVFSKLTVGENVSLSGESRAIEIYPYSLPDNEDKGIYNTCLNGTSGYGFSENVFVDVYGSLFGGEYGIQSSGNLQYPTKANVSTILKRINSNDIEATDQDTINYLACVPHVHIYPSAECKGGHEYQDGSATHYGTGVYAGGYASFLIEGLCYGANGVYIKNSDVKFNNANVYSDFVGQEAKEVVATGSGVIAAGSGVVIESNKVYKGQTSVVVQGDTKIAGGAGNAIEQTITTGEKVQLEALKILGGTIESGDKGGIVVAAPNTEQVEVSAGSIEGQTIKVKADDCTPMEENDCLTEVEIANFIPKDEDGNQTSHTILIYNETGDILLITVVIPGPAPTKIDCEAAFEIMNDADESIDFGDCEKEVSLTNNLTMKEIVMISSSAAQKIIVPEGKTLIVDYLVMGVNANITVEPGGKLIVKGNLGVKNVNASNIVLKANENAQATFVFAPEVTSNRNPYATVEIYTTAKKGKWQRFTSPLVNGTYGNNVTNDHENLSLTIVGGGNFGTAINEWNYTEDKWKAINATTPLEPFLGYALSNNSAEGGVTYTFHGNIVGNVADNLSFATNSYNLFGNSYTAPIDIMELIKKVKIDAGSDIAGSLYLWSVANQGYVAESFASLESPIADYTEIPALQTFIMLNNGAKTSAALDYEATIWQPMMDKLNPSSAPKRSAAQQGNMMRLRISSENGLADDIVLIEQDNFTADFEDGADADKYFNNGNVNIFTTVDDKDLAILASDNIEGTNLSIQTVSDINYTISFAKVIGSDYALKDNVTGVVTPICAGESYFFTAQANATLDGRFQIVNAKAMPTDMEKVVAKPAAQGIYTLMGQYVGKENLWNRLPAGVYIINGQRIVK